MIIKCTLTRRVSRSGGTVAGGGGGPRGQPLWWLAGGAWCCTASLTAFRHVRSWCGPLLSLQQFFVQLTWSVMLTTTYPQFNVIQWSSAGYQRQTNTSWRPLSAHTPRSPRSAYIASYIFVPSARYILFNLIIMRLKNENECMRTS